LKDILGVYMCDSSHVNATCALTSSGGVCQVIARQQLLVTCSSSPFANLQETNIDGEF